MIETTRVVGHGMRFSAICAALMLIATAARATEETKPAVETLDECRLVIEGRGIEKLHLGTPSGDDRTIDQPGASVPLPAGRYRVSSVEMRGGYRCTIYSPEEGDWFTLSPLRPHTLKIGAPLTPTVQVERRGSTLRMEYQLLGAGGRNYTPTNESSPPQFTVLQNGREIGSGSFRYG